MRIYGKSPRYSRTTGKPEGFHAFLKDEIVCDCCGEILDRDEQEMSEMWIQYKVESIECQETILDDERYEEIEDWNAFLDNQPYFHFCRPCEWDFLEGWVLGEKDELNNAMSLGHAMHILRGLTVKKLLSEKTLTKEELGDTDD